jgi:tRNA modification GTPase
MADADGVIVLWPADGERAPDLAPIPGRPALQLRSKADLVASGEGSGAWMPVSCVTGEGVAELQSALAGMVSEGMVDLGGETAIGERHRQALVRAAGELEAADFALPELAAEAVRGALEAVRELLGEVATEDLLDRIFASFCIGK